MAQPRTYPRCLAAPDSSGAMKYGSRRTASTIFGARPTRQSVVYNHTCSLHHRPAVCMRFEERKHANQQLGSARDTNQAHANARKGAGGAQQRPALRRTGPGVCRRTQEASVRSYCGAPRTRHQHQAPATSYCVVLVRGTSSKDSFCWCRKARQREQSRCLPITVLITSHSCFW